MIAVIYIPNDKVTIIDIESNESYNYNIKLIEYMFLNNPEILIPIEREILYKELAKNIYFKGLPKRNEKVIDWLKSAMDEQSSSDNFEYISSTMELTYRNILRQHVQSDIIYLIILYMLLYSVVIILICVLSRTNNGGNELSANSRTINRTTEKKVDLTFPLD